MEKREDDFRIRTSDGKLHDDRLVANAHQAGLNRERFHEKHGHEGEESKRGRLYAFVLIPPVIYLISIINKQGGGWYWLLLLVPLVAYGILITVVNGLPYRTRKIVDYAVMAGIALSVVGAFYYF